MNIVSLFFWLVGFLFLDVVYSFARYTRKHYTHKFVILLFCFEYAPQPVGGVVHQRRHVHTVHAAPPIDHVLIEAGFFINIL